MGFALDTSYVIDALRGRASAAAIAEFLDASGETVYLPAPVLFETRTGLLHDGGRAQAARFTAMLRSFPILPVDAIAAERAAEIQAAALAEGTARGGIDALIAGIALGGGHTLVTRDRGYEPIAEGFGLDVRWY